MPAGGHDVDSCHDASVVRFILPVKALGMSKSRLQLPHRQDLVIAMMRDTLVAVMEADLGETVLVSPDQRVRQIADEYRVGFLAHHGDLNTAIAASQSTGTCVVVLPDLPCLRPPDLASVVGNEWGFVPDAAGNGSTMAVGKGFRPRFGPDSARLFEADGMPRLVAEPSARLDVDTVSDLRLAQALGVGRHTQKWLVDHMGEGRLTSLWAGLHL